MVEQAHRTYLCMRAFLGVDDAMVQMLGETEKNGRTVLQNLLEQVTWTGLPAIQHPPRKPVSEMIKDETEKRDGDEPPPLPSVRFV